MGVGAEVDFRLKRYSKKSRRLLRRFYRRSLRIFYYRASSYYHRAISQHFVWRELPSTLTATSNGSLPIPAKIYRIFSAHKVPRQFYRDAHEKWVQMNPEFDVFWYDFERARDELALEYYEGLVEAWNDVIPLAFKSDLFRFYMLFRHGGVYIDSSMMPLHSLKGIFDGHWNSDGSDQFVAARDIADKSGARSCVLTGFLASTPRHPVIKSALDRSIKNILERNYGMDGMSVTGPRVLGSAINGLLDRPEHAHFDTGEIRSNGLHLYLFDSIRSAKHQTVIVEGEHPLIYVRYDRRKYDQFRWVFQKGRPHYSHLWRDRKVFVDQ